MKVKKIFLALIAVLLVAPISVSCHGLGILDVSNEEPYSTMIKTQYVTQKPIWMIGVSYSRSADHIADHITLVPGVGFTGPEVVFMEKLNQGSLIQIEKVLLDKSIFSSTIEYVVGVQASRQFKVFQHRIRLSRGNEGDGIELNTSIYKKVDVNSR